MDFVEVIKSTPSAITEMSKMAEHLFKNKETIKLLIDEIICNLDIQENSAGILILLTIKSEMAKTEDCEKERYFTQVHEFINDCKGEQIRYFPQHFATICRHVTEMLIKSGDYLKGVALLRKAIPKIQLIPSQLTSIHTDLCKLCLLAKCLKPALQFVNIDVTDISKEANTYDVESYLCYFYYGAIIYLAYRKHERAMYFLSNVINTPGSATSQIQLEAFKKFILVSLILKSKFIPPPTLSAHLHKAIKAHCKPYTKLAEVYEKSTIEELQSYAKTIEKPLEDDKNLGLVKQVIAAKIKSKIQNLTLTFMTLSLEDVKTKINFSTAQEAEKKILEMVEDGEIFAKIDHREGMVSFLDSPEKYDTFEMYRKIQEQLDQCKALGEQLAALDVDISFDAKYLQKIQQNQDKWANQN